MRNFKLSIFQKIVLGVLAIHLPYTVLFFVYRADYFYNRDLKRSLKDEHNYTAMGRVLIRAGEIMDLAARLSDAIDDERIHYYVIRKSGKIIAYGNIAGADDPIQLADQPIEGTFEEDDYRHVVIVEDEYELIVGHKLGPMIFIGNLFRQERNLIFLELGLLLSLVAISSLYNSRDLRSVLNSIKTRGKKRGDISLAKSKEMLVLVQGLKGYETNIESLSQENLMLKGMVLPALRREIFSGKAPPYEFPCTLVRTDINNFSSIFASDKRSEFMDVINDFFIELTHIVSRYNGYVYEFIGDEVLFYFKDEDFADGLNSSAVAISCIRDVHALASKVNEMTEDEKGYSFRVKTSLSYGLLRFGPLVDGYSLAGVPLIETVRLLSTVHEKSDNTALMDEVVRARIGDLCLVRDHGVVMLKGLPGARRTHAYQAHVPLNHHLRQERLESLARITYFRNDESICEMLDYVRQNRKSLDRSHLLLILGSFRSFKVTRVSVDIKNSYLELLEDLLEEKVLSDDTSFLLASVITAAMHIFPKDGFHGRLRQRLLDCLKSPNRRIVANTLDVFAEIDPTAGDEAFASIGFQDDNRIAGNTLVKQGKKDWNKATARKLRSMLRGKNPYFKASGLFALGEIATHLKKVDEVAYQADTEMQSLLEEMMGLLSHANKMVRRQALRSIEKVGRIPELRGYVTNHRGNLSAEALAECQAFLRGSSEEAPQSESNVIDLRTRRSS